MRQMRQKCLKLLINKHLFLNFLHFWNCILTFFGEPLSLIEGETNEAALYLSARSCFVNFVFFLHVSSYPNTKAYQRAN